MQHVIATRPARSAHHSPSHDLDFSNDPQFGSSDGRNALMERGARMLMANSGYPALTNIECTAEGASLSLHGHVAAYYHKQMAQEIARRVAGVRHINNYICVLE